jgi:hypothetical protein
VEWRKLHSEELNYLYSSPNIVRAGHAELMGRSEVHTGNLKERDHLEDPGVDGRLIFR